jgi:S1-C subfamily serine protease
MCIGIIVSLMLLTLVSAWSGEAKEVKLSKGGGIPFGILDRVFPFKYKSQAGTCFVIDIDDRQYIITARHLVPGIKNGESVQLYVNEEWWTLTVKPIFTKSPATDIVALATDRLIVPKMEIFVGAHGLTIGQDVYFLGFPHLPPTPYLEIATIFKTRHLPFIKRAIISAGATFDISDVLYLDGHNNPGFSGGPVIFGNYREGERLQIAGVISGYKIQITPVQAAEIKKSPSQGQKMQTKIIPYVPENSGIVIAYHIAGIVDAIRANPVGFPLSQANQ